MFIVKFFESMFTNGLKGNTAPSFLPAYILAWCYVNSSFLVYFLAANGDVNKKISAAIDAESINMFFPIIVALLIIVVVPWMRNIGLAAREGADYYTQKLLDKWEVKSYKTAAEYEYVFDLLKQAKADAQNAQLEINDLTQKFKREEEDLTSYNKKCVDKIDELNGVIDKLQNDVKEYDDLMPRNKFLLEYVETLGKMREELERQAIRGFHSSLNRESSKKELNELLLRQNDKLNKMDIIFNDNNNDFEKLKAKVASININKLRETLSTD